MTKREYAQIILEAIDEKAPTNVNWNLADQWLTALIMGIDRAEKESQAVRAAQDQNKNK